VAGSGSPDSEGAAGARRGRAPGLGGQGLQVQQVGQAGQVEQQELQGQGRFQAGEHPALALQGHLPAGVDVGGLEAAGPVHPGPGLLGRKLQGGQGRLPGLAQQEHVPPAAGELAQKEAQVQALVQDLAQEPDHPGQVPGMQDLHEGEEHVLAGQAQEAAHVGLHQAGLAEGQGLAQERHAVAHAARGPAGDELYRAGLEVHGLQAEDLLQVRGDGRLGQHLEGVVLAAREDRGRKLVGLGGGQDEGHPGRGLLQGLEQGVEGLAGEHVGFVDDEDLVAALDGRVADVLLEAAGVVDAPVGGAVDLDDVRGHARGDLAAVLALVAGLGRGGGLAVQGLGEDPGDGGLAHPAGAAEEVGRSHPAGLGGPGQDGLDRVLPGHLGKGLGPVLGGEVGCAHDLWMYTLGGPLKRSAAFLKREGARRPPRRSFVRYTV